MLVVWEVREISGKMPAISKDGSSCQHPPQSSAESERPTKGDAVAEKVSAGPPAINGAVGGGRGEAAVLWEDAF